MVWGYGGKRVVDLGGWDEDVIGREAEKVCCCFTYSGCTTLRSWMGGVASHTRTPYGPYPWALGFAGGVREFHASLRWLDDLFGNVPYKQLVIFPSTGLLPVLSIFADIE